MPYLDHNKAYEDFRDQVLQGIQTHFPIRSGKRVLELSGLEVRGEDEEDADDIRGQHKAKVDGHTWSSSVHGTLSLRDESTGKVISQKTVRLAQIPKVTRRRSMIVDGKEYQVDNQWQLKPGVYSKRRSNGELESRFSVVGRKDMFLTFDPKSKRFLMERGGSKAIPAYPVLKAMGVDDDALERQWGKEILSVNQQTNVSSDAALERIFRSDRKRAPKTPKEAQDHFFKAMEESKMRPDATKMTLGKSYDHITGDALRAATGRLLGMQRGEAEDDRDSLVFKDLRTTGDFALDRLTSIDTKNSIRGKVVRKMLGATDVRDLVRFDMFNRPVEQVFKSGGLARTPDQVNPVEMIAAAQQTTIMGPGGVQSQNAIDNMVSTKYLNPSQFGYLDPVRTPESEKSGVILRLPMGLRKKGKEPVIPLYNLKTGRTEEVGPQKFSSSTVVLPDQIEWKDGKPKPLSSTVKVSGPKNEIGEVPYRQAEYAMRHPSQAFSITTNLIPFLGNNSGNRATYAGQHIEQAISLRNREAPLVQVSTGVDQPGIGTFEEVIGKQAAHPSPISGTITRVGPDGIMVRGSDGKEREVQLYNNFPLNDPKSVMHSTPTVKVGDKVGQGQSIADTNYTRDGRLALGTNLRVAYLPYKGYNFEDGVVISRSASQKLSSEHMHKPEMKIEGDTVTNTNKFKVQHPDAFGSDQYKKLDDAGVVRVGQRVRPGDPLAIAMRPYQVKDRMSLGSISRALSGKHTDMSLRWNSDYEGEVVGVHKRKDGVSVHVRTLEPMQVGDKITGRHGNKGIVTKIIDDAEMPRTQDGAHIEVALNPSGVPGRMNVGQILETAAAKISQKTGTPYVVRNFDRTDQLAKVKQELARHKLTDKEDLIDPTTGLKLGKALVGPQYMLKLTHQVDKKQSARSGMAIPGGEDDPEAYDSHLIPAQGGKTGGQSIGSLDLYPLLAHGARANIREMQTWKSEGPDPQTNPAKEWPSQHYDVWTAMQVGAPLPTPRPTFSFRKFTDMLRASGVDVVKKGHHLQLTPLTDKQILGMSNGELKNPGDVVYPRLDKNGEFKPKPGGLFDEKVTGGHGGKKWSHMSLAEPVPNPVFEAPIRALTGLNKVNFSNVVGGRKAVKDGKLVDVDTPGAVTGGPAIVGMLSSVDVAKELKTAEQQLSKLTVPGKAAHGASTAKVDGLVKKVKYLRALSEADLTPTDAYVLKNLPVIPPAMRTPSVLGDGSVKWDDLNELYRNLGHINIKMKSPGRKEETDRMKAPLRESYYDGVKALMGIGTPYADQKHKGIMHQIGGASPKSGYFQNVLTSRRQDMSMRSTIVPEPALDLDEVGLPRDKALTIYKPFVVKQLVDSGAARDVLEAHDMLKPAKKDPSVFKALDAVVHDRPVILKRDPALHRHSMQAFRPKIVSGKAIKIHPLVTSGYNADFDGDTMSAFVPISNEAVDEAKKMMPSNNLYSEASGRVMYSPTLESALGLYKLSRIDGVSKKKYKTAVDAVNAVNAGKLGVGDLATIAGKKTTVGRALIASALPDKMQSQVLTDRAFLMDRKGMGEVFTTLANEYKGEYGEVANKLKDLGNGASYGAVPIFHGRKGPDALALAEDPKNMKYVSVPTHSLGLDDLAPDKQTRDRILGRAQRQADAIYRNTSIPSKDRQRRASEVWMKASEEMDREHVKKVAVKPTNLSLMLEAGVKPSPHQYKQMVLSPVLMTDAAGRIIPTPIKRSYSEGLDLASYWTQMHGARRGTVMKVQEVQDPGVFSKYMIQNTMNMVVNDDDCGTDSGVAMSVGDKGVHDRRLAKDFKARGLEVHAGALLDPQTVDRIRAADKNAKLVVRSPLKCQHATGLCRKCAGIKADGADYDIGTNVGVLAAQSVGERSVQLTMKAFHTGGVVQPGSGGSRAVEDFARVQQLTSLPEKIPNAATLSMKGGKVERIERDPTGVNVWIGGVKHHVGRDSKGMGLHENLPNASKSSGYRAWRPPKIGDRIEPGQLLSDPNRTSINVRDLYRATNNMERVQNYMVDELSDIYGDDVRRQHIETVVRAMGNLTKIRDPGDGGTEVLKGEFQPASRVRAINRALVQAGRRPIEHAPVLKGINTLPHAIQEDWMARLQHTKLRETLLDSAAIGARSNLHGYHPIPGVAYGAEFGFTEDFAHKPGLSHLKDVPRAAY